MNDISSLLVNNTVLDVYISNWDESGVTDLTNNFANTSQFIQDISSWNDSSVLDLDGILFNETSTNDIFLNANFFNESLFD